MAIISAGIPSCSTQGDRFSRQKTPPPKSSQSGSRPSTPQQTGKDTFMSTAAWRQQFEIALNKAHTIEKSWQQLDIDKKIGINICELLQQSIENYDNLTALTQQGREWGISEFKYSLDGKPQTYALPQSNTLASQDLSNCFKEVLDKIEQHPIGSEEYGQAISDFILTFWD